MTMHRTLAFVVGLALLGCKKAPPAPELLDLQVFATKFDAQDDDPFKGVSILRLVFESENGTVEKFVHYVPGGEKGIPEIPYGDRIRFTVEGWAQDSDGGLGDLLSRGKSAAFSLQPDVEPISVQVPVSRINRFAYTSTPGELGARETTMSMGRVGHTATRLRDGRVLIVGGASLKTTVTGDFRGIEDLDTITQTAELYDPATGTYQQLQGQSTLSHARAFHTATLLPNGQVLIAGGVTDISGTKQTLPLLQLFDPSTDTFLPPIQSQLNASRAGHTETLLDGEGHVLLSGGFSVDAAGKTSTVGSVEVFERSSSKVVYSQNLNKPRAFHTATKVALGGDQREGVVLIGGEAGDQAVDTAEIFYISPAGFDSTPIKLPSGGRTRHAVAWVPGQGYLYVIGGFKEKARTTVEQRVDFFHVANKAFLDTNFALLNPRGGNIAVALPDNSVLIAGGVVNGQISNSAEVIFERLDLSDPNNPTLKADRQHTGALHVPRVGAVAVPLDNGTFLLLGGYGGGGVSVRSGEYYNPL